jgi:glutathione S-transferase
MYTLFYLPGTCSMAVHVALYEIGAHFTLQNVAVANDEPRSSEYLAINPRGSVPTLLVKDEIAHTNTVIREGAAILIHLLETHKSPLLPTQNLSRAKALEWLAFANATLHPAYSRVFFLKRNLGNNAAEQPVYLDAIKSIQKCWDEIELELEKQPYICGSECTIADILITVISNWSTNLGATISFGSNTKKLFKSIITRPSYQKALNEEHVEYKIAV